MHAHNRRDETSSRRTCSPTLQPCRLLHLFGPCGERPDSASTPVEAQVRHDGCASEASVCKSSTTCPQQYCLCFRKISSCVKGSCNRVARRRGVEAKQSGGRAALLGPKLSIPWRPSRSERIRVGFCRYFPRSASTLLQNYGTSL